jgi:hypothetical protein
MLKYRGRHQCGQKGSAAETLLAIVHCPVQRWAVAEYTRHKRQNTQKSKEIRGFPTSWSQVESLSKAFGGT